jgi:hypothetical protein
MPPSSAATAILAWLATLDPGGFVSIGQSRTATVYLTQGIEMMIQAVCIFGSNVSLASTVAIYASNDGGANFDTEPTVAFGLPQLASGTKKESVRLTTGIYAIQMQSSSPSTTMWMPTYQVLTAYFNFNV